MNPVSNAKIAETEFTMIFLLLFRFVRRMVNYSEIIQIIALLSAPAVMKVVDSIG